MRKNDFAGTAGIVTGADGNRMNKNVYKTSNGELYAHVRFLVDEYNKHSQKRISLGWDSVSNTISLTCSNGAPQFISSY